MRLFLQLKGELKPVVYFTVGFVGLIVLLVLLYGYKDVVGDLLDETACFTEVKTHSASLSLSGRQFASKINSCGPDQAEIKDLSTANFEIAKLLTACWYEYGEGKLNLYEDDYLYCNVCDVINFADEGKKSYGLNEYMLKEKVPGTDFSFMQFLQGHATDEALEISQLESFLENMDEEQKAAFNTPLETDKTYATIFVYAKGENAIKKVSAHLGGQTTAGKIGGGVALFGVAAWGARVGVLALFGASNPIGWVSTIGTVLWVVGAEVATYIYSPEGTPEYVSIIMLAEHSPETFESIGCERAE